MAEHTPAPWTVDLDNAIITVAVAEALEFAFQQNHPSEQPTEEDYANARLIAEAPALLEALEQLVDEAQSLDFTVKQEFAVGSEHNIKNPVITKAQAAIAKARGTNG